LTGTPLINRQSELDGLRSLFGTANPPMIRRFLEDVAPDIPPKTRCEIPIRLRDRDARKYNRVESDFGRWLEKELARRLGEGEAEAAAQRALAAEALVKIGYLRRTLGAGKVYAAADWIGKMVRLGEPVVVFVEHQDVLKKLRALLQSQRIRNVVIEGSTSRKKRAQAIDDFQAGKVAVFIGTKAAKEGITLTRARNLLFVERYWTSAEEEQAEDRIRRIGQKHPTRIWFLRAPNTVDDRVAAIIDLKRTLIRNAIGAADVTESPQAAVEEMIASWGSFAETAIPTELGHASKSIALPSPSLVSHLLFSQKRWNVKSAKIWARMTGYHSKVASRAGVLIKLTNHNPALFSPGSFRVVWLSQDIRAVVGSRKESRSTRRLRGATL
jgi:SNF2 family DNA or RNA helicase